MLQEINIKPETNSSRPYFKGSPNITAKAQSLFFLSLITSQSEKYFKETQKIFKEKGQVSLIDQFFYIFLRKPRATLPN